MIKSIIIDDEFLSIEKTKYELLQHGGFDIVRTYTDALEAKKQVKNIDADIIFLDISMPSITGIELAKHFKKEAISAEIVFLTAFSEHAVTAFEIEVLDYLLKPVTRKRLEQTYQKCIQVMKRALVIDNEHLISKVTKARIYLNNGFSCYKGDHCLKISWRTNKVLELFVYFLLHQDVLLRKEKIIEDLWGSLSLKQGIGLLNTTLYQLRKVLKDKFGGTNIIFSSGYYQMTSDDIELEIGDLLGYEENQSKKVNKAELKRIINTFTGELLPLEPLPWINNINKKLFSNFSLAVDRYSTLCLEDQDTEEYLRVTEQYASIIGEDEMRKKTYIEVIDGVYRQ